MSWWYPLLSLCMGVGAFIIARTVDRIWRSVHTPRSMSEYYPILEESYLLVVHKIRELNEAVALAADNRKRLPPEYRAILDQVLNLARLVEQASYDDAVANGVVPRYWFGGPSTEVPIVAEVDTATGEKPGEPQAPSWRRVGGQLVPWRD